MISRLSLARCLIFWPIFSSLLVGCGTGGPKTLNIDLTIQKQCEDLVLEHWNQDREPNADDVWGCINQRQGFKDEQGNVVNPRRDYYPDWKTVVP